MGAHVYPHWMNPAANTEKKPGYYVGVYLQIRNDGNEAANCYCKIAGACNASAYNVYLEPGGAKNIECGFTMPNNSVTITYSGAHGEGSIWVVDFSKTITIKPSTPDPTYCSQKVYVKDQNGAYVSGARVKLTNSKTEYINTNMSGYVIFNNLQENRTHYLQAEKSGYMSSAVKSFNACTGSIYLTIEKACSCGSWFNKECVRDNYRRQTRTCTPSGCDVETREIYDTTCKLTAAKGEITLCKINELSCPNCGQSPPGKEITVIAEMRNVGNKTGEFRFYIVDKDTGATLSKEPDFTYKNVGAGATWRVEKSLLVNLNFNMPNKKFNGLLKIIRQT